MADRTARVLVEVALFVFALLQGAAAYLWIVDRHRANKKAQLEGKMTHSSRFPIFATVLAFAALLAIALGFWMIFHPPIQLPNKSQQIGSRPPEPDTQISNEKLADKPVPHKSKAPLNEDIKQSGSRNHQVIQTMRGSPGGMQAAGDINVNTDRRLTDEAKKSMISELKAHPCNITVGALGMGGETEVLANSLFDTAQKAQTGITPQGIFHGIGMGQFTGLLVKYSVSEVPTDCMKVVTDALVQSKIFYQEVPDSSLPPNSLYLYIGYKPDGEK